VIQGVTARSVPPTRCIQRPAGLKENPHAVAAHGTPTVQRTDARTGTVPRRTKRLEPPRREGREERQRLATQRHGGRGVKAEKGRDVLHPRRRAIPGTLCATLGVIPAQAGIHGCPPGTNGANRKRAKGAKKTQRLATQRHRGRGGTAEKGQDVLHPRRCAIPGTLCATLGVIPAQAGIHGCPPGANGANRKGAKGAKKTQRLATQRHRGRGGKAEKGRDVLHPRRRAIPGRLCATLGVIPAQAGIHGCPPGTNGANRKGAKGAKKTQRLATQRRVGRAGKAGKGLRCSWRPLRLGGLCRYTFGRRPWIPACAGMTQQRGSKASQPSPPSPAPSASLR
jgi:hypothetical protein